MVFAGSLAARVSEAFPGTASRRYVDTARSSGRPVVAHRAGAYAADRNTLIALRQNNILVDSSVFWKHPNTRLHDLGLPRNVPSLWDDHLTQIPVTVFERENYVAHRTWALMEKELSTEPS